LSALRIAYAGVEDLAQLIDLSAEEIQQTDLGSYRAEQFLDDVARVTERLRPECRARGRM
jgi:tricarballylate dehydrogenase